MTLNELNKSVITVKPGTTLHRGTKDPKNYTRNRPVYFLYGGRNKNPNGNNLNYNYKRNLI